ncbi:kinase-like protein, partial [Suillus lakei]
REAYVWITLEHDNILTFNGVIDGFGLLPALVSPWMENWSLDSYLKKRGHVSKVDKQRMLRQIAAGLEYCTSIISVVRIRRARQLTNVLIDGDGRLCLADFGLPMILAESQNNSCYPGNVRWMAPEMLATPEQGGVVIPTKAADVYSYSCIMLQV